MTWRLPWSRRPREVDFDRAGAVIRALFPEAVAFAAQQWVGMERALTFNNPAYVTDFDLTKRMIMFVHGGTIYHDLTTRFGIIEERAVDSLARTGMALEEARSHMLQGIVIEGLVSTGEDRSAVTKAMYGDA